MQVVMQASLTEKLKIFEVIWRSSDDKDIAAAFSRGAKVSTIRRKKRIFQHTSQKKKETATFRHVWPPRCVTTYRRLL